MEPDDYSPEPDDIDDGGSTCTCHDMHLCPLEAREEDLIRRDVKRRKTEADLGEQVMDELADHAAELADPWEAEG